MLVRYEGEEWTWNEEFNISQGEASESNNNAVDIEKSRTGLYTTLVIALIILTALIAYWLGRKKNRR